jgi:hypothetical protein
MGVRVPEDLSIIGFDDADLRHAVYPMLTAVCQDAGKLGFQAAAWLGQMLRGTGPRKFQKTIPTFFEINRSTAPPSNGDMHGVTENNHVDSTIYDGAGTAISPAAVGLNGQDMRGRS